MPVNVIVATVNAGEWQLLYVDGELEKEDDEIGVDDIQDATEDVLIEDLSAEYRIGDVESWNAPETYEELCEVTNE